ncbi:MAG: redoxin family protein [Polyangiaceae bacterium]
MKTSSSRAALIFSVFSLASIGCGGASKPAPVAEQPIGLTPSTGPTPIDTAQDTSATASNDPQTPEPTDDTASSAPAPVPANADVQVGQHAPDLVVDALGSAKFPKMSALAGKTVVVHFWASWCTPCKKEMADLDALAAKHRKNLTVIGVSVDDDRKSADAFLAANKVKFANGFDSGKAAAKAWGLQTMPTTFVIDKKGNVATILPGAHPDDVTSIAKKL